MAAPFSYTHPSNIAIGYRARPEEIDYARKAYPGNDYPMHHGAHCKLPRSNSNCCTCVDDLQEALPRRPDLGYRRMASDSLNGARASHDMVAAYGLYSQDVEETEFESSGFPQQVVVVASQRDGSTARTLAREGTIQQESCCRPAVPLVLVALFVICFLLVSGVLFYFNIMTYAPESSTQDICEGVHCAYGGICVGDVKGHTVCRCPMDCPSVLSPVCGTDGITYNNMCSLRLYSCTHKKTVLVQHSGECPSQDPCETRACPAGARCIPSPDGRSASCLCPRHCPQYSSRLALSPVCGTDNRDYKDQCHLHRQACENERIVAVKYEGACDPCADLECPEGEVCQLDEDRQPVCSCRDQCADQPAPICGSNGFTYANECAMRLQACREKKIIRIIYRGTCSSGVNPCKGVVCSYGEECTISKFGIAQCECVSQCEPVVRQVCGTDGRTYDSECHLRKSSCFQRFDVSVMYNGPCDYMEGDVEESSGGRSCKDVSCEFGGLCVMRRGEPLCDCPRCSVHFEPLCGSDGLTYTNPCHLRSTSCRQTRPIEVVHQGACNGCETKACGYFSSCETDEDGIAHCVCIESCPKDEIPAPVCGTDNITYESICELRRFVCESKLPIELDYEGDCELCLEIHCKYGARCRAGVCVCPTACPDELDEPVCASNMETYTSECEMQKQACASNPPVFLNVIFFGACNIKFKTDPTSSSLHPAEIPSTPRNPCLDIQCDFDATCEFGADGYPRCSCLFDCSQEDIFFICGSDFRMYNSTCAMKMEACQRQKEIRLRPLDLCKGMEVRPCNGERAVTDAETGEDIDCGNGPHRQDCPMDSYCHQTPHFARCCPKEAGVYLTSCQDSWYGCCPDKKTPAQGPEHLGCPSLCGCNKIGSYSEACVGDSEQCHCKPGVGGLKCDRCQPGYWGLPKINSGYQGCLSCDCSALGSVREDCEQMTGRCVCKPGVQGHKCDTCVDSRLTLTDSGCNPEETGGSTGLCEEISCFHGAVCQETQDSSQCVCSISCPEDDLKEMVCGDDGKLYASKCQLKQFVCQVQKDIGIQNMDYCSDDTVPVTELSVKQWTLDDPFIEIEGEVLPLTKYTHRLLSPDGKLFVSRQVQKNKIDPSTKHSEITGKNCYKNPCSNGGTCEISHLSGTPKCICPEGFHGAFCTEMLAPQNELF